jgi:5-methylcytosine-specific restriction endonuclease McrA
MNDGTSQSRPWADKRKPKERTERTHSNNKFYSSKSWRLLRKKYINDLIERQHQQFTNLDSTQKYYLLDKVPVCERCLELFMYDVYEDVSTGYELDHTDPINPDNALDTQSGLWGNPLDETNLKLLCTRHHAKKTAARDKKLIRMRSGRDEN